jgi:hypothetical protein
MQLVASEGMNTTGRCPLIAATVPTRAPESWPDRAAIAALAGVRDGKRPELSTVQKNRARNASPQKTSADNMGEE